MGVTPFTSLVAGTEKKLTEERENFQIWVYRSAINPNLSEIRLAACEIPAV